MLDDYMRSRGIKYKITGMKGAHTESSRGIGHGDGYKFDIQPLNSTGRQGDRFDWATEQFMITNGFMSQKYGSAGFHTMNKNRVGGWHYDLTTAGDNVSYTPGTTIVSGEMATETVREFAQTSDDIVPALMALARETNAKNKQETVDKIVWDPTDVTGSIACWGIVQLNSSGKMQGG